MIINQVNLDAAFTGFKVVFNAAFQAAQINWDKIAMQTPSATSKEVYPWLGKNTRFREWIGPRAIQGLATHGFTIVNKSFENTVAIDRDDFEDDSYGIYSPLIGQLGQDTKVHPDILVFGLLKSGTSSLCYDGQNYFDTDHPGFDANAGAVSVSNFVDGPGPAWYLFDTTRIVKPIILQQRRAYQFIPRTRPDDPNVFDRKEYVYGVDGRSNVGFGLWQLAYCSKQPLTPENYGAARAAMGSIRLENGDAMDVTPNLLVVDPSNEGAANTITKADIINNTSNVWKGTADVLKTARIL
jgi:phage major head subunit gpT-like protein